MRIEIEIGLQEWIKIIMKKTKKVMTKNAVKKPKITNIRRKNSKKKN